MSSELTEEEKKAINKEEQRLKEAAEKERLKDEEAYKKQTDAERKKYFKGTIVVIVIYGLIILGMSIAGIVWPTVRELLFVTMFPFTVTFISGVILIIMLLLAQLFTYKPAAMPEKYSGDNMSCPDFWILKKTKKEDLDKMDKKVRQLSKYYCENPEVSTDNALPATITNATESSDRKLRLLQTAKNGSIDTNYHMKCNRLYPDYMASLDKRYFPLNPTSMRCEYLAQCESTGAAANGETHTPTKIAWTSVCPK
jgi:hypothetical protein